MNSIVLAYDGSEGAKRALERTAELANGASVTVVTAVNVLPGVGRAAAAIDPEEIEERRRQLQEAASLLAEKGVRPQTVELHAPNIAEAVVEQAKEAGADLIVVGTGGKNLPKRVVLGSVSSKIVHEADCDVLVVR